jgi:predicted Zn-dependent peptidase
MTAPSFRRTVLPSGLTVLSEAFPHRQSLALGVWLRAGARDEPMERLGITHFIEHMMFKGTETRDARAIALSLEALGGHLDAFTAREQVCYYARALAEHLAEAVDVLADLACRPRFDPADVAKEKSVVREEIYSCEDDPEDKVHELQAEQLWGGHPLGRPILGTVETVDALDAGILRDYFGRRYRPEQLVVSATGAVEHGRLVELVETHFRPPAGEALPLSPEPGPYRATLRHEVRDDLQQLYLSLGNRGLAYPDPDRYGLVILHTLLGGGMSSRLFQSVREEAGLAYSVYSTADFHRDCGALGIHLGVAPERGREALARVRGELMSILADGPGADEVEAARSQLVGSVRMGQESISSRMYQIAHDEMYHGRYVAPEEQLGRLREVTHEQVTALARRHLDPARFSLTALGPAVGEPLGEADWPIESTVAV